ncbi:MAG: DUF1566 domain-containing protein [Comamonadaceae bacterium]|nr:MAG: DUF1566 domain-containing protein [Comamonadaceae bacterium]
MPNPALPLLPHVVFHTAVAALLLCTAVIARPVQAAPPDKPAAMRASDDGLYVLDDRAKLAWPRCVEGMQWNGRTCTGEARLFTYSEAQALANARWKAEGVRWRLPRVPELRRLVDRSRQPPMISPVLFPATPMQWHWTGTASVNTATVNPYNYGNVARGGNGEGGMQAQQGWAVDMETGEVRGTMGKGNRLPVRLVRPQP